MSDRSRIQSQATLLFIALHRAIAILYGGPGNARFRMIWTVSASMGSKMLHVRINVVPIIIQ